MVHEEKGQNVENYEANHDQLQHCHLVDVIDQPADENVVIGKTNKVVVERSLEFVGNYQDSNCKQ